MQQLELHEFGVRYTDAGVNVFVQVGSHPTSANSHQTQTGGTFWNIGRENQHECFEYLNIFTHSLISDPRSDPTMTMTNGH